jgi:hypothetical protein
MKTTRSSSLPREGLPFDGSLDAMGEVEQRLNWIGKVSHAVDKHFNEFQESGGGEAWLGFSQLM